MTMQASGSDVIVARVLSQDDKFMTLELAKSDKESFTLQEGDQFLTLIFVTAEGLPKGHLRAWKPWEPL